MPVLTTFTVEGRDAIPFLKDQSLTLEPQLNGRMVGTASFVDRLDRPNALIDIFRPEKRDVFLIEFDDGRRFGGVFWDIEREHLVAGLPDAGLHTFVRMVDYNALLDVVWFNEPVATGSLESQLEAVLDNVAPHGITLSGDQETGPTLGNQIFEWRTIRQILDTFSLQSGWVWRIDADGIISMIEPGSLVAAEPISEALGNYRALRYSDSLNDYRNEAWIRFGPHGVLAVTEEFDGDGSTREWTLGYQLSVTGVGVTTRGVVTVTRSGPAVTEETIDADPIAGTAMWHFDQAETYNNALIHDSGEPVLGVGETVSITYYAFFPGAVFDRDAAEYAEHGPWTTVIDRPDITDRTIAQTEVEAYVTRIAGDSGRFTIELVDGADYEVGQTVELDAPVLGFEHENVLITEIRISEVMVDGEFTRTYVYVLTAIQGNAYRENWMAFWRQVRGEEGTGGTPTIAECSGVTLWSDNFNSADPLTDDYTGIGSVAKVAGVGPDGSQAVQASADNAEFIRTVATTCRTGTFRCNVQTSRNAEYWYVLEVRRSSAWILSIYRNDLTATNQLEVYISGDSVTPIATSASFWSEVAFIDLLVEWQLSTEASPGVYNADGYVRVYKDGVLVVDEDAIELHDSVATGTTWDNCVMGPQGVMDDIEITNGA